MAFLWGMVVDGSGVCIEGATVRQVRGRAVGQKYRTDDAVRRVGLRRWLHFRESDSWCGDDFGSISTRLFGVRKDGRSVVGATDVGPVHPSPGSARKVADLLTQERGENQDQDSHPTKWLLSRGGGQL